MKPYQDVTTEWIEQGALDEICLALAQTVRQGKKPGGALLARLAQRLIQAEVKPGGPYYGASHSPDFFTNLAIAYLFVCLQQPLPGLTAFIDAERHRTKHSARTRQLLKDYDARLLQPTSPRTTAKLTSYAQATRRLSTLEEPLKTQALRFLLRIEEADKSGEIALLPTMFYHSLVSPFSFPPLATLGELNVYTWLAYTIYDHVLDGEPLTDHLPVANTALRLVLSGYRRVFPPGHSFHQKVDNVFTAMDTANSWEARHCRFKIKDTAITIDSLPAYGRCNLLAQRSYAHVLGPLALVHLSSPSPDAVESIEKGLSHYLIARQLNDDLHDWQQDMRAGQASAVVTYILKQCKVKPGDYTIDSLITRMQANFWNHSMEAIAANICRHVDISRKHLLKSGLMNKSGEFFALLTHLEDIARQSSKEHDRFQDFADTYRQLFSSSPP